MPFFPRLRLTGDAQFCASTVSDEHWPDGIPPTDFLGRASHRRKAHATDNKRSYNEKDKKR